VALLRTDFSQEYIASIISELGKTLAFFRRLLQLLVTANVFPTSLILFSLMMEAILSSETSVLTRAALYLIPKYGILHISSPPKRSNYYYYLQKYY
jgi:hypothetical protein